MAPQQEDDAPVEGKGKGKVTEQPMEVLKIKVPLIKKRKWPGEDGESEDREEEAEGSGSIGTLIFELLMCLKVMDLHGRAAANITWAKHQHSPSMWKVHTIVIAMSGKTIWQCTPATQPMPTTPPMDPATPAEMEEEGDQDPIAITPTPSPPHKKPHCIQPHQPGEANCAYMPVDTFQQVLMQEHMTWLEHKMAKMTSNMCHWWDDIVTNYLKLNQCIRTMEDNQ
ncbi:hypothetical protein ID866_12715, partial [Astraeus odoratus]